MSLPRSRHGNRQKHESRNPIQRAAIANFHRHVVRMVRRAEPGDLLDVGCGQGYTLHALARAHVDANLFGVDLDRPAIEHARVMLGPAASVRVADAANLNPAERRYDLVMMLEVLEHLENPDAMLERLSDLSHRWVLLSVPHEPFFRGLNFLRGKHMGAWGNDPEHVQHWGRREFIDWVGTRFRVFATPLTFPWTLVLAQRLD